MLSSLSGPELFEKRLAPQSTCGHDARAAEAHPPDESGAAGPIMLSTQVGEDAAGRRPMLEPDDEPAGSDCIHIHISCSPDALAVGSAYSLPLDAGVDEERRRSMTEIPGLAAVLTSQTRVHSSTRSALAPLAEEPTASSTLDVEEDKLEAASAAEQAGGDALNRATSCDSELPDSTFEKVANFCSSCCQLGTGIAYCLCACFSVW